MIQAPSNKCWYTCQICGDVSKNPLECCGQMMTLDHDRDEWEEFQNYILEES